VIFGSQIGGKSSKNRFKIGWKNQWIFVRILESFFLDFLCFLALLGTRKTSKNDGRGVIFFDFRDLRFEIDSNVFWDHFWEDFWIESRSQILQKSCKNAIKKTFRFYHDFLLILIGFGGAFWPSGGSIFEKKNAWKIVATFWWFLRCLRRAHRVGLEAPQGSFFYTRI